MKDRYRIHHFDRDETFRGYVCTPAPVGAWPGIDCRDGAAGCGVRVSDLAIEESGYPTGGPFTHPTLDLIANGVRL